MFNIHSPPLWRGKGEGLVGLVGLEYSVSPPSSLLLEPLTYYWELVEGEVVYHGVGYKDAHQHSVDTKS